MLSIVSLLGGLAFFLYGMTVMSSGLEKLAGSRLQTILKRVTKNPVLGISIGMGITFAIQSSSAFTVMLVGLVNSGILDLGSTVAMLFGSDIGTTFTAWILALNGINTSSNPLFDLLKPQYFSLVFALVGVIFSMMSKRGKRKDLGNILVGFAVLMAGMTMMSNSMDGLSADPAFQTLLLSFNNPLFALLASTVFTGVIQSSAATIGIVQAIVLNGDTLTWGAALPLIFGANIGTCVTAMLSAIGVNKDAKRVAVLHTLVNTLGSILLMIVIFGVDMIVPLDFINAPITIFGIAIAHTGFNTFNTLILYPFKNLLVRFSCFVVRDGKNKNTEVFIDDILLKTPAIAVSECNNYVVKMSHIAKETLLDAISLIVKFDTKKADNILELEDVLDKYEDKLGSFLVKLSAESITEADSRTVARILHTIGDFERIGDHAVNLLGVAQEIKDKQVVFSEQGQKEIATVTAALIETLDMTIKAFESNDIELAAHVEPLEQVIDVLIDESKLRHVDRLTRGFCTIQHGFVHSDLLANYERISDHCSNIAAAIIELGHNSLNTHEYLHSVKDGENSLFSKYFSEYSSKYSF